MSKHYDTVKLKVGLKNLDIQVEWYYQPEEQGSFDNEHIDEEFEIVELYNYEDGVQKCVYDLLEFEHIKKEVITQLKEIRGI